MKKLIIITIITFSITLTGCNLKENEENRKEFERKKANMEECNSTECEEI